MPARRTTAAVTAAPPARRQAAPAAAAPAAPPARRGAAPAAAAPQPQRGRGGQGGPQNTVALLQKALRTASGAWKHAQEESKKDFSSGTTLDDGPCVCSLTDIKVLPTSKGPMLLIELTGMEDAATGLKGEIWHDFTDEGMTYLARSLRRLGVPVDEIEPEDLIARIPEEIERLMVEQPWVRCKVVTNDKGYKNIYINKLLPATYEPGDGGEGAGETGTGVEAGNGDDSVFDNGDGAAAAAPPARGGRGRVMDTAPAEEPAAEPEAGAEGDGNDIPQPGDSIKYKVGRKNCEGIVRTVDEENGNCAVKNTDTKATDTVPFDNITEYLVD